MASSRSSPLPCGTPSMMSMRTTSQSSLAAIQCAAVAPTLPEPTTVTFFLINDPLRRGQAVSTSTYAPSLRRGGRATCVHVLNDVIGEFAGAYLRGAFHQPLKIIGNPFLLNGVLYGIFDQTRRFLPANEFKHHHAGEDHRARVDDVFVRILRRRA